METSKSECIEALQRAAEKLGPSFSKKDYEDLGLTPASATIIRVMGGWNDAKEAADLETNRSRGSRVQDKPSDVELPDGYEWEALSVDQRWHYRNVEENTQRSLDRRADLRKMLHDYKADSDGCRHCGELDPACLDFHHREDEEKEMAVNKMVPYGYSRADIKAELEKCNLLCANCHWKTHHGEPTETVSGTSLNGRSEIDGVDVSRIDSVNLLDENRGSLTKEERLRAWTHAYKHEEGCRHCTENNPICLQFHHTGEKTLGVGAMITNCYPEDEVISEAEQCEVLCANCHRKEHYEEPNPDGR